MSPFGRQSCKHSPSNPLQGEFLALWTTEGCGPCDHLLRVMITLSQVHKDPRSLGISGSQPGLLCPMGTCDKASRCSFFCKWGEATNICGSRARMLPNLLVLDHYGRESSGPKRWRG